jgi:hypothetical protein
LKRDNVNVEKKSQLFFVLVIEFDKNIITYCAIAVGHSVISTRYIQLFVCCNFIIIIIVVVDNNHNEGSTVTVIVVFTPTLDQSLNSTIRRPSVDDLNDALT